jgi:hypothetical protein
MPSFQSYTREGLNKLWPAISQAIDKYCDGKGFELVIRRMSKKRSQEQAFNCKVQDIANAGSIEYMGKKIVFADYPGKPFDVAKAFIVTWLEADLRSQGKALSNPSICVIEPISGLPLMLRATSTLFTVKECGWALTLCDVIGAENRIAWTDPKTQQYEEWNNQRMGLH